MIKEIKNLDSYIPKNKYSHFVKQYFSWILKNGTEKYIKNIDVEIKLLEVDDFLVPLSFGNSKLNCYTTSLTSIFVYWKFELYNISNFFLKFISKFLFNFLIFFWKVIKIDNIVYVNNFLLSTNLYPNFTEQNIKDINLFIKKHYPNKIIFYRSLNYKTNQNIINNLLDDSFKKLVSRQIFIFERNKVNKYSKLLKLEKYFKKYWLKLEKANIEDSNNILKLYNLLYLKKYTNLNPQFSIDFIEDLLKYDIFHFYKLLNNDNILWIIWYFIINNQTTTPFFWYDIHLPKKFNLYEQINYILILKTLEESDILNASSWAWKFKKSRWAELFIEYNLLYLPKNIWLFKKLFFKFLILLSEKIIEKDLKNNIY